MTAATEARARQLRAYADHHAAVADFRRRREADQQARIDALLSEVVAALVPLFDEPVCRVCRGCRHALSHGSVRCPVCGSGWVTGWDAGAAGWPAERTERAA